VLTGGGDGCNRVVGIGPVALCAWPTGHSRHFNKRMPSSKKSATFSGHTLVVVVDGIAPGAIGVLQATGRGVPQDIRFRSGHVIGVLRQVQIITIIIGQRGHSDCSVLQRQRRQAIIQIITRCGHKSIAVGHRFQQVGLGCIAHGGCHIHSGCGLLGGDTPVAWPRLFRTIVTMRPEG
jgi:hypothetical protein